MIYTKVCSICKLDLPLENYHTDRTKKDQKRTVCKSCTKRYTQINSQRRREYAAPYYKLARRQRKLEAIAYKGGACAKCHSIVHEAAFDFHHNDSRTKDISVGLLLSYSWDKITNELDKCSLLCANCHRIIHYKNGGNRNAFHE